LYSLEMHVHFRHEVKQSDELSAVRRLAEHAATIEMMLLHVHQGEIPKSAAFPVHILSKPATLMKPR
jgi:hypothetical protein